MRERLNDEGAGFAPKAAVAACIVCIAAAGVCAQVVVIGLPGEAEAERSHGTTTAPTTAVEQPPAQDVVAPAAPPMGSVAASARPAVLKRAIERPSASSAPAG